MRVFFCLLAIILIPNVSQACLLARGASAPIPAVGIDLHQPIRVLVSAGGDAIVPCEGSIAAQEAAAEIHVSPGPTAEFDLTGMDPEDLIETETEQEDLPRWVSPRQRRPKRL